MKIFNDFTANPLKNKTQKTKNKKQNKTNQKKKD